MGKKQIFFVILIGIGIAFCILFGFLCYLLPNPYYNLFSFLMYLGVSMVVIGAGALYYTKLERKANR